MNRVAKEILSGIEDELISVGFLYRIFYRVKEASSLSKKIEGKGYSIEGKKLQDFIGVRITTYFKDDVDIIVKILKQKYQLVSEAIDAPNEVEFKPARVNLVFRLEEKYFAEFSEIIGKENPLVDSTFEIQLRTVLSEGWHEVDHDLRYKCKEDWESHKDLSRALNGIYATLETSDWSMLNLFQELAYRNYKKKSWVPMLRNKFRLRLQDSKLDQGILECFESNGLAKAIFRLNRNALIHKIVDNKIRVPLNVNNLVYLINYYFIKDENLIQKTPKELIDSIEI